MVRGSWIEIFGISGRSAFVDIVPGLMFLGRFGFADIALMIEILHHPTCTIYCHCYQGIPTVLLVHQVMQHFYLREKYSLPPNTTPPTPNNKTSPLLHIGSLLGGFNIGGLGVFSIGGRGLSLLWIRRAKRGGQRLREMKLQVLCRTSRLYSD